MMRQRFNKHASLQCTARDFTKTTFTLDFHEKATNF